VLIRTCISPLTITHRTTGVTLDYESIVAAGENPSFNIAVRAMDAGGLSVVSNITIILRDINDPPGTVSLLTESGSAALTELPEDTPLGVVGMLTVDDEDVEDSHTFYINSTGTTFPGFSIQGSQLLIDSPLDYEAATSVTVRIYAVDSQGAQSATYTFVINVLDRPDVPGYFTFTLASAFYPNGAFACFFLIACLRVCLLVCVFACFRAAVVLVHLPHAAIVVFARAGAA
jgi:hypothetical protein